VDLIDVTGRVLMSRSNDAQARNDGLMRIDVNGLAQGEYVLRIQDADGASVHRVMVR